MGGAKKRYEYIFPWIDQPDELRAGGFVLQPRTFGQEVTIRADLTRKSGEPTEEEVLFELIRWSLVAVLEPDETLPKRTVPNPVYQQIKDLGMEQECAEDTPETIEVAGLAPKDVSVADGSVDRWIDSLTSQEAILLTRAYTDITTTLTRTQVRDFLKGRRVTTG